MRVLNFTELENEYHQTFSSLDTDDINERNKLLISLPYSVIVECDWLEFENLEKWAKENIDENPLERIGYGKTAYDFGCFEYFFKDERNATNFSKVVPQIFTTYPNSYPPNHICKSDGYDNHIDYDPTDTSSIIY